MRAYTSPSQTVRDMQNTQTTPLFVASEYEYRRRKHENVIKTALVSPQKKQQYTPHPRHTSQAFLARGAPCAARGVVRRARTLEVYHPTYGHCRVVALRSLRTGRRRRAGIFANGSCVGVKKYKPRWRRTSVRLRWEPQAQC